MDKADKLWVEFDKKNLLIYWRDIKTWILRECEFKEALRIIEVELKKTCIWKEISMGYFRKRYKIGCSEEEIMIPELFKFCPYCGGSIPEPPKGE